MLGAQTDITPGILTLFKIGSLKRFWYFSRPPILEAIQCIRDVILGNGSYFIVTRVPLKSDFWKGAGEIKIKTAPGAVTIWEGVCLACTGPRSDLECVVAHVYENAVPNHWPF